MLKKVGIIMLIVASLGIASNTLKTNKVQKTVKESNQVNTKFK